MRDTVANASRTKELIVKLYNEHPEYPMAEIARQCNVTRQYVLEVRKQYGLPPRKHIKKRTIYKCLNCGKEYENYSYTYISPNVYKYRTKGYKFCSTDCLLKYPNRSDLNIGKRCKTLTKQQHDLIIELYNNTRLTYREIAQQVPCSCTNIYRFIKNSTAIKLRGKGNRLIRNRDY